MACPILTHPLDFMKAITSGDMTKIGQVLGPQIRGVKEQGQQTLQTMGQFGNRGGGTNAAAQTVHDKTRSTIDDMIAQLTGSSVTNLGNQGMGLVERSTERLLVRPSTKQGRCRHSSRQVERPG